MPFIDQNGKRTVRCASGLRIENNHVSGYRHGEYKRHDRWREATQMENATSEFAIGFQVPGRKFDMRAVVELNVVEAKPVCRMPAVLLENCEHP